jgi:hypothetical protein
MRLMAAATAIALAGAAASPAARGDDRAAELLARARTALGGEALAKVTALTATGEIRRVFGEREITGDVTVDLGAPDRIRRTEEMGMPGGPSMTRTVALDQGEFWEDTTNRGGGGFMRMAPGGGPGGPGGPGGREITEEDRQRFRDMQKRRLQGELQRYLLVWLLRTDAPAKYVGRAEAEDGSAEVIEFQTDGPGPIRLFLDERTSQPLMLSYEGFRPRFRMMSRRSAPREGGQGSGGQGVGTPPAAGGSPMEPPERVTFELRLDDYRQVDDVLLPHRLTESIDGNATEEWTIGRYKLNPSFKASYFQGR